VSAIHFLQYQIVTYSTQTLRTMHVLLPQRPAVMSIANTSQCHASADPHRPSSAHPSRLPLVCSEWDVVRGIIIDTSQEGHLGLFCRSDQHHEMHDLHNEDLVLVTAIDIHLTDKYQC